MILPLFPVFLPLMIIDQFRTKYPKFSPIEIHFSLPEDREEISGRGRGQQRSALKPFLTSPLALRPFLTSPLSAQTLSFRSALHPFAISAQRSYLILDRRSALKTFISFQRSALKAIFQNRSALKDPPCPPIREKPKYIGNGSE